MLYSRLSPFYFLLLGFLGSITNCLSQNNVTDLVSAPKNIIIDIETVVKDYKPEKVLDYDEARKKIYTEIYNVNDTITCMYTGYTLGVSKNDENPIGHLMKLNPLKSIITEHSYPKSKGAMSGNVKSDMHHLFPVRLGVNVARYNHPFGEVPAEDCKAWFSKNETLRNQPESSEEEFAKKGIRTFEPKDNFKGNVARAVFYFFTMYNAEALENDPDFFDIQKEVLLQWHLDDPVDNEELLRTKQIAIYQSSRPNPFIIDQTLALRMYGTVQE